MRFRLSYTVNEDQDLVSNIVGAKQDQYFAIIRKTDEVYEIIRMDAEGPRLVFTAPLISTLNAKIDIRKRLQAYGVLFDNEVRSKGGLE